MLRCGLCMGYGARARVQVGIRTEVEPVWGHTPSLAPISLPSAALGPLPCAHLAQNPPSRCEPNGVFYPVLRHRAESSTCTLALCILLGRAKIFVTANQLAVKIYWRHKMVRRARNTRRQAPEA